MYAYACVVHTCGHPGVCTYMDVYVCMHTHTHMGISPVFALPFTGRMESKVSVFLKSNHTRYYFILYG